VFDPGNVLQSVATLRYLKNVICGVAFAARKIAATALIRLHC